MTRTTAASGLILLQLVTGYGGPAAAAGPLVPAPSTSPGARPETIIVMGRRPGFSLAPQPSDSLVRPAPPMMFGPGSTIGAWTVEGGPFHDATATGLSAGLALHVPGISGLDLVIGATRSRDAVLPAATVGATSATVGLRLRF